MVENHQWPKLNLDTDTDKMNEQIKHILNHLFPYDKVLESLRLGLKVMYMNCFDISFIGIIICLLSNLLRYYVVDPESMA